MLRVSIILAAILTAIKLIDILLIDIVLVTSYCTSSCCCSCHSESCANYVPNLTIILAASYSLSSSPHLTRSHSRHVLLAIVLAAGVLIDIVLVTVYSTTFWCLCHSESCANHVTKLAIILAASYSLSSSPRLTRSHSRHVLLAIVLAAGVLIAILLIVVRIMGARR